MNNFLATIAAVRTARSSIYGPRRSIPNESDAFSQRAAEHVRDDVAGLPGFLDARILESDDQKSVIVLTRWQTRHAWAQSQWNQKIGQVLAESFQSAVKVVDTMCYERATLGPLQSNGERSTPFND